MTTRSLFHLQKRSWKWIVHHLWYLQILWRRHSLLIIFRHCLDIINSECLVDSICSNFGWVWQISLEANPNINSWWDELVCLCDGENEKLLQNDNQEKYWKPVGPKRKSSLNCGWKIRKNTHNSKKYSKKFRKILRFWKNIPEEYPKFGKY